MLGDGVLLNDGMLVGDFARDGVLVGDSLNFSVGVLFGDSIVISDGTTLGLGQMFYRCMSF